jgi:hypothetical protein
MKIGLQSDLLHITQPCCYWVFDDYLDSIERREQEWLDEQASETVEIEDTGQPWLSGEGSIEERHRQGQGEFYTLLWNYVMDAEGNGKFSQAMRFMPKGEADVA